MAMIAVVQQVRDAIYGAPCPFVLTLTNQDAVDNATILSIDISVTNQDGKVASAANIGEVAVPPGISQVGAVGTSQYNISVPPSSSVKFGFNVSFFGATVTGALANASPVYTVVATMTARDEGDDSVFSFTSPGIVVPMNRPAFGPQPGSPPNKAPVFPGGLDFTTPANSAFAL